MGSVEQFALVKPVFGPNADKSMIGRLDAAWREANQLRPGELAAALRGASATAALHERHGSVENGVDRAFDGNGTRPTHGTGAL